MSRLFVNMILYVWVLSHSVLFKICICLKTFKTSASPDCQNTAAIKTHYYCFTVLIWLGNAGQAELGNRQHLKWVREAGSLTALTASVMESYLGR